MISINEIFEEYFIANPEQKQKFTVEEKVFDLFFKNGIGKVLKSPVDKENLIGRYLVELFHATQDSGSPIKAEDEEGKEYELGSGQIMNVFKPILKHYIEQKTIPENETGKKFFTVLSKIKEEKFGAKGKRLNLQVAYAPVVGKFSNAVDKFLKDLQVQIDGNPTNKEQLEQIQQEVEEYRLAIDAIANFIKGGPNADAKILFTHGDNQQQNEAIDAKNISTKVQNVLNKAGKQIELDPKLPENEQVAKRIMLQLKLIGRRMDKLMGKAPKGVLDADIKTSLKEKGAYATGLLGFIQDLFRKNSKAFRDLLISNEDEDKNLQDKIISASFGDQLDNLENSLESQGIRLNPEQYDSLRKKIVGELVKDRNSRERTFFHKVGDKYVPLKVSGGTYVVDSWTTYVKQIKRELLTTSFRPMIKNKSGQFPASALATRIWEGVSRDSQSLVTKLDKTIKISKKFEPGDQARKIRSLIIKAIELEREESALSETKKRKAIKNLIHIIEQEIKKSNQQKLVKTSDHEVNIHTIRK